MGDAAQLGRTACGERRAELAYVTGLQNCSSQQNGLLHLLKLQGEVGGDAGGHQ